MSQVGGKKGFQLQEYKCLSYTEEKDCVNECFILIHFCVCLTPVLI